MLLVPQAVPAKSAVHHSRAQMGSHRPAALIRRPSSQLQITEVSAAQQAAWNSVTSVAVAVSGPWTVLSHAQHRQYLLLLGTCMTRQQSLKGQRTVL